MDFLKYFRSAPPQSPTVPPQTDAATKAVPKVALRITQEDRMAWMRKTNTVASDADIDKALLADYSWVRHRAVLALIASVKTGQVYWTGDGLLYNNNRVADADAYEAQLIALLLDGTLPPLA